MKICSTNLDQFNDKSKSVVPTRAEFDENTSILPEFF